MSTSLLLAHALRKTVYQGDRPIEILHGIDLELYTGERIAILGPSGAGKSTLLHILGLMDQFTSGTLTIQDREVQSLKSLERAQIRSHSIGFLFQFHYLLPELTVLENVALPARIIGMTISESEFKAREVLATILDSHHFDKKPYQLSGGEQQRVALARALVNRPSLVLADEPTGNLDRETGEEVLKLLWNEAQRSQTAVVIVTHQEDIAQRAGRWIRLRDGKIESTGNS